MQQRRGNRVPWIDRGYAETQRPECDAQTMLEIVTGIIVEAAPHNLEQTTELSVPSDELEERCAIFDCTMVVHEIRLALTAARWFVLSD